MDPELQQAFNQLKKQLEATEERINERIEATETRLLTEFHKWASPVEMRARSHSAALRAMDIEIESIHDRVKKLEDGNSHSSPTNPG